MTTVINSRQARIAEWQRQYRGTEYGPADLLFVSSKSQADRVKWSP